MCESCGWRAGRRVAAARKRYSPFPSLTSSKVQHVVQVLTPDLRSCVPGLGGVSVASAQQQLLSLLALGCHMSHVTPPPGLGLSKGAAAAAAAAAAVVAAATAGVAVRARTATSGTQFTCFTSTRVQILTHARDAITAAPTEGSAPRGCVRAREKERAQREGERASERGAPASVRVNVADKALTFSEALCGKVGGALSGTSRPGAQFTRFSSTNVQILTPEALRARPSTTRFLRQSRGGFGGLFED